MELRAYAETMLFAPDLESKLLRPKELEDDAPGAALTILPSLPARPGSLRFLDPGESRPEAARFPSAKLLRVDRERGRVMHFFANHELLALELMALMLLRFPEAPASFRRLLAATMLDEQRHLTLYLERMSALSVSIGDLPCGRFFWDNLKDAPTPRDFLAGMSLTFEQANLDFSLHYLELMAEHDDAESRDVLQRVHDDEVRHVRRGLDLFREQLPDEELFAGYRASLRFPLGPHHGKGRPFSRSSRRLAGLPEVFIDEMEVFGSSRGRPPRVHLFNPAVESELAGQAASRISRRVEQDLAILPALVATPDDIVLVPELPSLALRLALVRAGFPAVDWLPVSEVDRVLAERNPAALQAFGPSPRSQALARRHGLPERGFLAPELFRKSSTLALREDLASEFSAIGADSLLVTPRAAVCSELDELLARMQETPTIVKADLASAGRGSLRCRDARPTATERARLASLLEEQGQVVVEELLDREVDLSLQLDALDDGRVVPRGFVRFYTDDHGRFLAAETATAVTTMTAEQQRFLAGEGESSGWFDALPRRLAGLLQRRLEGLSVSGPCGIDMMLVRRSGGELALQAMVEFNPRLTMGRIALALGQRVKRGTAGLFLLPTRRRDADDVAFIAELALRHPLQRDETTGLLVDGLLLLGEPHAETLFLPALALGEARRVVLENWVPLSRQASSRS